MPIYTDIPLKTVERGVGPIGIGIAHAVPGGIQYTMNAGQEMDVYLNGQLLVEGIAEDYQELTSTTITFNFTVPANSNLTYYIR